MFMSIRPMMGKLGMAALLAASALLLACATPGHPGAERRRELLVDGSRQIDVVVDGRGPAIVLLPSARRDSLDYDDLAELIAREGFMVLRPQPRGMGRSSPPPPGMTLATLASDVAFTIERLGGGKPAIVVGHAYGHWVARVTDMNHPKLVRGVAVVGAAAKAYPPSLTEGLGVASDPTRPEAERIEALKRVMFAPGNDPRPWLEGWYPQWGEAYRQASRHPPKDAWFNSANAPILDLQGAQDAWRPAASRNELKDLFGSKVTVRVIDNAGHAFVPEQPAALAAAIVEWARTLRP